MQKVEKVQAFADRIEVRDKAHIAANGKTGGGEILIGGDIRGSGSDPPLWSQWIKCKN